MIHSDSVTIDLITANRIQARLLQADILERQNINLKGDVLILKQQILALEDIITVREDRVDDLAGQLARERSFFRKKEVWLAAGVIITLFITK